MVNKITQANIFEFETKAKEAVLNYDVGGLIADISAINLIGAVIGEGANESVCQDLNKVPLNQLLHFSINDYVDFGLTENEAIKIHATFLLAKKLMTEYNPNTDVVRSPGDAFDVLKDLQFKEQEEFVVMFLDTKSQIIKRQTIFVGSLNSSIVHPREVFREAVRLSSSSMIVSHNHPSGDPTPSQEDLHVTRRLVEAGKLMGIQVLDHIIIGQNKYTSLKEKGYI